MTDISTRFAKNPLLAPKDLQPSQEGLEIACLLNPAVFRFQGKTWLLVRVAERPPQRDDHVSLPVLNEEGRVEMIRFSKDDPELDLSDPRVVNYRGADYLTTLSHLRLFWSVDGVHFEEADDYPKLVGEGLLETFGIEDCRVCLLEGRYYLTFTAVSPNGVAVGLRTTTDWRQFEKHGLILPPHNKDCAVFDERIGRQFYALHRPSSAGLGGNYIWLAQSPDGLHWGHHQIIARTRKGHWDSARVGAGAAPIKTNAGWLEIYHGADAQHRYCLGALLLDLNDPSRVIGRTAEPIMEPSAPYEVSGFFGHVVFSNGHVVNGDELTIYYGAADEFVCGARFSIQQILSSLS